MQFLILSILLLASTCYGEELTHQGHTIYVDNPQQWEVGKDLFGIPFILFSPQKNTQRSNISFAHSGVELELDIKTLKNNQKDYQDNKIKWAQTHDIKIEGFLPYQSFVNLHKHQVHSIGMSYTHKNKTYIENSFYIECKGKIVFSKGLRLKVNEQDEAYFKSLINSLDCGVI